MEETDAGPPGAPRTSASYPRRTSAVILALVGVLVVSALPLRYPDGVHMATEAIRVYAAMALAETGQTCVNPLFDRFYPGWEQAGFLPNIDAAVRDGCYLLDKAPLMSWLAVPVAWVFATAGAGEHYPALTLTLVLLLVTLPVLLGLLILRRVVLARGLLSAPSLDLSLVLLLVASPFLANMGLFLSHALVGVVVLTGLGLSLGWPRRMRDAEPGAARPVAESEVRKTPGPAETPSGPWRAPFLGGLALGCAVLLEYPSAFFVVATGLALLADPEGRRRVLPWIAGGIGPLIALLVWNTLVFGGPLELSYAHKAHTPHQEIIAEGFFGLSALRPEVLWGLTFGASRGLFFHAPWAIVAFAMVLHVARDPAATLRWRIAIPLTVVGYALMIATFTDWEAGQVSVGPRHLVVLLPLLAFVLARGLGSAALPRGLHAAVLAFLLAAGLHGALLNVTAANVFAHMPDGLANPIFEVIVPVLLEAGPNPTVLGGWFPPALGHALQLVLAIGLLLLAWTRACAGRHAAGPLAGLGVVGAILLLALAVTPQSSGPDAEISVLRHRQQIHDLRGHPELATEYRRLIQIRRAEREGRPNPPTRPVQE